MKQSSSSDDLKTLLEAIKSADVVESRIQLLSDLQELNITEKCDLASLIGALTILWEDFTCLDISQCMLNKAILHVAKKYLDSDMSGCTGEFLGLGIKASVWSRKHIKMTVLSTDESPEEEHSGFFYQLLLDVLSYSVASFSSLARNPISNSKELMLTTENFILEQLNLTKDSLSEIKRISAFGTEIQKAAQLVLDAVIRLCKVYSNGVNWDVYSARSGEIGKAIDSEVAGHVDHVMNIAKYTIDKLCEVGILAANDGGSLVSVLNLSWKGVVTVLQLCRGGLATRVNVAGVILNLILLANQSLRHAAQTWSLQQKEAVSAAEAKRIFLPVKFFLINAVRIISQYPTEAISVCKDVAQCVILISTLRIYFSMEELLKAANKELVDILEPTSFHLLNSMINSPQVKQEEKFQFLDWLFGDEGNFSSFHRASTSNHESNSAIDIFFTNSVCITGDKMLVAGQISLFLDLLKSSSDLENDVKIWMTTRLSWLLEVFTDEDVYSASLVLQVPMPYASNQKQDFAYQPFLDSILSSLKTFMIFMSSSSAWCEIETFLLENLSHPHILCSEIVTELWSFMLRHAEADVGNDVIEKLCSLLKFNASPESLFNPSSALRKLARSICTLVSYGSEALASHVYISVTGDNNSQYLSIIYTALLKEGFPLNSLPESTRSMAKQRVVTEYFSFLESFGSESPKEGGFEIYGTPVFALCAALQFQQVSMSDTEMKTLKFLLAIIYKYRKSMDKEVKNIYCRLLGDVLQIISNMKHLYSSADMERVILELQNLFISKPSQSATSDNLLFPCKPNLAYFMAVLGHVELADSEDNPKSSAVWELYHILLRERHWAFAHLAITTFGYFAARTSCNELWRFVPHDAALSFDIETGNEADEDRFMSELKEFLEKESTSLVTKPSSDNLQMLIKEGKVLKEVIQQKIKNRPAVICDAMEIDEVNPINKKRKFPDGICKGVELLQSGIKVMGDGLSQWQHNAFGSTEMHKKFLTHFSHLEDAVAHLASLANSS